MFLLFIVSLASADTSGREVRYNRHTEIDFEALDISGEMIKPQGTIIIERQNTKFPPVMQPRMDFNLEMTHSVEEIK